MSDRVLNACRRGHKASDTERAFALLRSASIPVVGQMMIGLPEASSQDEISCAEVICKMGAVGTRIYPTLVFRGTELEELYENGHYVPLTVSEAVERSKSVLDVFVRHGVPCLRIGLCESENLHSDTSYVAGPNHSEIGELVMSRFYRDRIFDALPATAETKNKTLVITHPRGHASRVVGHRAQTKRELRATYGYSAVKLVESDRLTEYHVEVAIE